MFGGSGSLYSDPGCFVLRTILYIWSTDRRDLYGSRRIFFAMSDNPVYLTEEGLQKLKDELRFLKTTERRRIIREIADARAHGDLSENAEYHAAKDAQGLLEAKIAGLESTAQRARLLDESLIDPSKAFVMSWVTVRNHSVGKEITYKLVSAQEADFTKKKISVDSPIGKALLGKSVGDVVEVKVPAGILKLEVLDLARD